MRTRPLPIVSALAALCGLLSAADVPVTRVVLFSSGVGYFEHTGTVDGTTSTDLRFKTDQINDILKSLVVEDQGGGRISSVAYPSQDPLDKTLKSFQLDLSGSPSIGSLLAQLRGAVIKVSANGSVIDGVILGVESQSRVVNDRGDTVVTIILNLLSGTTVRSIPMNQVSEFDLVDPALRAEVGKALTAIAQARDQDQKPVTINFEGQGQRAVRLGYVVEAPVWKTSYRLVLNEEPATSAIQGWAIVENQTDSDWNDVQLTLVSGRPISFVQDLYRPQYIKRPVFVPELFASLGPVAYVDGLIAKKELAGEFAGRATRATGGREMQEGLNYAADDMAGAPAASVMSRAKAAPMDITRGVQSMANAEKLGEFFHYSVHDVDLTRQRSAMLPIITDPIQVERISIYNASVQAQHPLLGAKITNTTGKHLLGGPITVFDAGGYCGDARIEDVPPKQDRLISFAIDLQVRVLAEATSRNQSTLTATLIKGVLSLKQRHVSVQSYDITNKSDDTRRLMIEHPRQIGWELVDTTEPKERTETLYRFSDSLAAGENKVLKVTEQRVDWESMHIVSWDSSSLLRYQTNGAIPEPVRQALAKAAELKKGMTDVERAIDERTRSMQTITTEQERIRANMNTVQQNTQYYQRLLAKLNDQETQLDNLRNQHETLTADLNQRRAAFESYLNGLNLK